MQDQGINPRKIIVLILALWFGVFVVIWLVNYLTTGTISVTVSGSQNTVTITNSGTTKSYQKQAVDHLTVHVHAGTYLISVQGHVWTTNKVVTVRARQKLNYHFSPTSLSGTEPVAGFGAADLMVNTSGIFYVDPGGTGLYNITTQNLVNPVPSATSLQSVSWGSGGFGVGEDSTGNLYSISNGVVSALPGPEGFSATGKSVYAAAGDDQVYASVGKNIYSGDVGGNYKQIYSVAYTVTKLIPFNGGLGVLTGPGSANSQPTLTVISSTGSLISSARVPGAAISWSPDGKQLIIGVFQGSGELFDGSLHRITSLPGSSLSGQTWLNNHTVLYSSANDLWMYDTQSGNSRLLTALPPDTSISDLALDQSRDYIYFSAQNTAGSTIERVGLANQRVSAIASQLGVFFPKNLGLCTINFVNFTQASLYVTASGAVSCQEAVASELSDDGLDSSQLSINYVTTAPTSNE